MKNGETAAIGQLPQPTPSIILPLSCRTPSPTPPVLLENSVVVQRG